MLLLNEIEAAQITGETEQAQIEAAFARRYPQTQILLTLGGSRLAVSLRGGAVRAGGL